MLIYNRQNWLGAYLDTKLPESEGKLGGFATDYGERVSIFASAGRTCGLIAHRTRARRVLQHSGNGVRS
jgi:hypothetical protein